jgi:hypothetical protein
MNDRPIMFRASAELFQQLESLARNQQRSIAWVARKFVEDGLKGFPSSPSNGSPPQPYMSNNIPPLSLTPSPSLPKNNSIKTLRHDPEFDTFWQEYPRKTAKEAARKAWAGARARVGAEAILTGLRAAVWPLEARFIPHPATWLNQGRWDDQPAPVRPRDEDMIPL